MELVINLVLFALGVYAGMTLMACLVTAGRADRQLDAEARAKRGVQCDCDPTDCCLHAGDVDSNHCPLRTPRSAA
jgi:hypothetical protein